MEQEPKPFKCRRCKRPLARTDGMQLYDKERPVPLQPESVKIRCDCGFLNEWRQLKMALTNPSNGGSL